METKKRIEKLLVDNLNTVDKRFMFFKIFYPKILPHLNLEGTNVDVSFNIVEEFRKRDQLESLLINLKNAFQ